MNIVLFVIFELILIFLLIYILTKKKKIQNNDLEIKNNKRKLDVAVIVEPRKDKMLIKVIKNYLKLLPNETKIQIFHGTKNKKFINKYFKKEIDSNKICLSNLKIKNLNIKEYNRLLTSEDFYNKINGENILIFQMDTGLCSKTDNKIEDFLEYDYVGAPWSNQETVFYNDLEDNVKEYTLKNKVGNGGLSFRKKSQIIKFIKEKKYDGEPEDVYFSKSKFFKYPNVDVASKFSTEFLLNEKSYGYHAAFKVLNNEEKVIFGESCPEFNMFL